MATGAELPVRQELPGYAGPPDAPGTNFIATPFMQ
jgi:hypothetical protein